MVASSIVREFWRELEWKRGIYVAGVDLVAGDDFHLHVLVEKFEDIQKLPAWWRDYRITGEVGEPGGCEKVHHYGIFIDDSPGAFGETCDTISAFFVDRPHTTYREKKMTAIGSRVGAMQSRDDKSCNFYVEFGNVRLYRCVTKEFRQEQVYDQSHTDLLYTVTVFTWGTSFTRPSIA